MSEVPGPVHWLRSIARRALHLFESERDDTPPYRTKFELHIQIERDELDGGWVAEVDELPGCLSQGETEAEALVNISDAIAAVLSARIDEQVHAMTEHEGHARHEHRVQVAL